MQSSLWTWAAGIVGVLWLITFVYETSWKILYKKLPPGSMGWPLIGELIPHVRIARSETPYRFTREREKKYGPVYRTSLLTGKTIMFTDAESVKFVLQNEGGMIETGYPRSVMNVVGEYSMLFQNGELHKRMHAMLRRFVSSTPLKKHLTREMEILTKQGMSTWTMGQRILLQDEIQRITHDFLMKHLFGLEPGKLSTTILNDFHTLLGGIIGIPVMIPGTAYYKAMKAREKLTRIIRGMVASRKAHPEIEYKDILQALIEEVKEDEPEAFLVDNVQCSCRHSKRRGGPAYVNYFRSEVFDGESRSTQATQENFAIRQGKGPGEGLTWNEYMSLEFTQSVFNETLRLANGAQGVMRKAVKDIEYRGYILPKGWTMLPYFLNIHFDEKVYPDPTEFRPSRWLEKNIPSSYFLPFGGGARICPGLELAGVQTAVFLHHFVTHFKWEAEPETVINFPTIRTKNHLPVVLYNI